MGVYSNQEILSDLESGNIYIDPFNEKHLNTTSYDVTLGTYFYKSGNGEETSSTLYNPYEEEAVAKHFGELMQAEPLSEHTRVMRSLGITAIKSIPADHPVIILRPGERILAHTHEFIGILSGTTSMQARSTTGRNGVVVCMDAGWGDAGYADRWTMEIKNMNEQHVVLPVGIRIAQIVFHKTGLITGEYSQLTGKYQTTRFHDHETTKKNWKPENMLPKAYKDTIEPLQPVEGTTY